MVHGRPLGDVRDHDVQEAQRRPSGVQATSLISQHHWNTVTLVPRVAAMLSRKPAVAFREMTTERKVSCSRSRDSPVMTRRYLGERFPTGAW